MTAPWSLLADKARNATREAQAVVVDARQRVEKLEASGAHIDKLRADYVARYQTTQQTAHTIGDNLAYRQFLEHLQGLRERVQLQIDDAARALADAKAALKDAQREQAKMEAMVERDLRLRADAAAKREQRTLDEAGIRAFNLR